VDKALDMGKSSATGGFQLLVGVAVSTIIMAVGTIILTRFMPSSAEYGLYGAALIPASILNYFRDWGVNYAMTKQIASLRAANKTSEIHDVIVSGVIFELFSGAALSLLCFVAADFIAFLLNAPDAAVFISIMSISIFASAIFAAASGIFVGYEKMKLNSLTIICQAIVKTAVGPLLVLLGYGVLGAIVGAVLSYVAAGVIGISIVYYVLFKPIRGSKVGKPEILKTLKPMLKFGVPLTVSNVVIGVLPQLFNSFMFIYAGAALYGNYTAALNFAVLLTFVTVPINTVLLPAFSKLNLENDPSLMQTIYASSVKYTALLLIPATLAIMVLSTPLVNTLFGYNELGEPKYAFAPLYLALTVAYYILSGVGTLSVGNFLAGLGETKLLMKQGLLTLVIGVPLAAILIPSHGIVGGIIGSTLSGIPSMIWGLYWIWNRYKVKTDYKSSVRISIASIAAAAISFIFLQLFASSDWLNLLIGIGVFLVAYLVSAPLVGAINQADVNNLRTMFSGLGPVSKIIDIPLKFIEQPLKIRHKQNLDKNAILK
jgi:O-antigen/teichoic acid export membrane protein